MTNLIDYAWAQIPAPAIKEAGYIAAMRYLGGSARLTPVERDNLFAAGLGIGLVWETAADEADHPERGQADAVSANQEADALGYPDNLPIFFADDQNDPDVSQELDYFQWVRANSKRPVGVYSGGNVVGAVMEAEFAEYGWMVETWYPDAGAQPHLIQLANSHEPVVPGFLEPEPQYDSNVLVRPFPLWGLNEGDDMTPDEVRQIVEDYVFKPTEYGMSRDQASMENYLNTPTPYGLTRLEGWVVTACKKWPAQIKKALGL